MKGGFTGQEQAYSRLLVFLIGGNITGILLLLHLLSGDHRLLVNFTLGHLGSRLALLVLVLVLLLQALAGARVNAALVVVGLPDASTYGGARIGNACPDAGLFPFQ